MANFIYDNLAIYGAKSNPDPNLVNIADPNQVRQYLLDIQSDWRSALWYGYASQAADPAPAGITSYVWVKNDNTLHWHTPGGADITIGSGSGSSVPSSRQIITSTGLSGGGDLSADRTLTVDQAFSPTWTGQHTFNTNPVILTLGATFPNSALAVSAANTGRLRYNTGTQTLEASYNTGVYSSLVQASRQVTAGTGITGGGDLSANRSFAVDQAFSPTWTGSHTFQDNVVALTGTNPGVSFANSGLGVSAASTGRLRYVSATQTLQLSVNGGAYTDIGSSAGSVLAIGATVTSGTAKSVLFVNTGPVLAQDNANFAWDSTNHFLGLGTNAPGQRFHSKDTDYQIRLENPTSAMTLNIGCTDASWAIGASKVVWVFNSTSSAAGKFVWNTSGQFAVNGTAPAKNLDVTGDGRFTADVTFNAVNSFAGGGNSYSDGSAIASSGANLGRHRYNNTTKTFQVSVNGNGYFDVWSKALLIVARRTADTSITTNVTLANVTDMVFAIAANEEFTADFVLDTGTALATTGIKLAVTTPAGATQNIAARMVPDVTTALNTTYRRTTGSGTTLDFTAATLAGVGDAAIVVSVWVSNAGTAGNVQLQAAQSTSSGTALLIRKGSELVAHRQA